MSVAGTVMLAITDLFRIVQRNPSPVNRENALMTALTRLASAIDKMATEIQEEKTASTAKDATIAERDATIEDLKAKVTAAEGASTGAITEADLTSLIEKAETVVGHVDDPDAAA